MANTKEQRKLTGADGAYVNVITRVKDKDVLTQAYVARGEELPGNLADGEEERLEAAGAFDPDTHRERQAQARAERNRRRGGIVSPSRVNNPKTPDVSAPAPGTPMAPPLTQDQAVEYGDGSTPSGDPEEQGIALEDHTVAELKEIADEEGVEYASDARKADLVQAISDAREGSTE